MDTLAMLSIHNNVMMYAYVIHSYIMMFATVSYSVYICIL